MKKIFWKIPFYKLPMKYKIFTAKLLMHMMRGFGETFNNDIVLYTRIQAMNEELELWIKTDGRPTTSNVNYQINKMQ
jgi:hypothetical protein